MDEMSSHAQEISITYEGEALQEGTMDFRELAFALLSLGQLLEESNRVLNQDQAKVSISVNADFQSGSFGLECVVVQTLMEQARGIFTGGFDVVTNLVDHIFEPAAYVGAWELLKRVKGKLPRIRQEFEGNEVRVNVGGTHITINKPVFMIANDPKCRKHMAGIVEPLKRSGVDTLTVKSSRFTQTTEKAEAEYFNTPETLEENITRNVVEMWFSIVNLSFKEGLKWRLTDGDINYYVSMGDREFWEQVNNNEIRFTRDDRIKLKLRITQTEDDQGKQKTSYEALQILEHRPGSPRPQQRRLPN